MSEPVITMPTERTTKPVTIVVLSKYREIFEPFFNSIIGFDPQYPMIVVRDGTEVPDPKTLAQTTLPVDRIVIQGPENFQMAGNGNLGLKAVPLDHDILYCGDDIRFIEKDTIEKLQKIAYQDEKIGILSPRLIGRGSPQQVSPKEGTSDILPLQMWFPCVYIKRELIDKIGYLDEQFNGFGSDDLDYNIRTLQAGYKLAVTSEVSVRHLESPEGGPTTFCKKLGVDEWQKQQGEGFEKLRNKLGVSEVRFQRFMKFGRVSDLVKIQDEKLLPPLEQSARPSNDEAMAYLRSRKIFIATPAYGSWLGIEYVRSLANLMKICADAGVDYTIAFLGNESLVTRARNKMVNDFMKTDFTDFFFIDADIGFDPRGVISLLFHDGDIIGAPCARKNLRLDRIVHAVKRNGREYSQTELENLLGEFVLNFPADNAPTSINLGGLVEVQEVGTGLMRVRRETFDKFRAAYPDRWYMQMAGETGNEKSPIYLYFQAEIDEDSKKFNSSGLPDYISEDWSFCRLARKAGMKVFLAPWVETNHMGSYFFKSNMMAVSAAGGSLR